MFNPNIQISQQIKTFDQLSTATAVGELGLAQPQLVLLFVTFGYFWSWGPQDQKYTFGGGICRIFLTLNDYYQPYQ